jgi:FMN-dependent NADH-azoreductase
MPVLLQLDSSADLEESRSRSITRAFAAGWQAAGAEFTVVERDLHLDPLPHLPDASLHWPVELRRAGSKPPIDAVRLQRELLDELLAADALVVGAPMYNYSMPSSLKAWIDYIHVPGITASYEGSARPLEGRPAVIVQSRGGSYDEGSATEGWDHGVPPLQLILGDALGMAVTVLTASLTLADDLPGLADRRDRSQEELAMALSRAAELGTYLATDVAR